LSLKGYGRLYQELVNFWSTATSVYLGSAEGYLKEAVAILEKSEIPTAAWRVHAAAGDLQRHLKNDKAAETHRERAQAEILANSFAPDEPLGKSFLTQLLFLETLLENTKRLRISGTHINRRQDSRADCQRHRTLRLKAESSQPYSAQSGSVGPAWESGVRRDHG
jgi:hypothetical protein